MHVIGVCSPYCIKCRKCTCMCIWEKYVQLEKHQTRLQTLRVAKLIFWFTLTRVLWRHWALFVREIDKTVINLR